MSIDSFSEKEDFFTGTPPDRIGHNLAVGACSDLLACGVKPEMILQSWNLDESKDTAYYQTIAEGIESVLRHYGAHCIGGDTGTAAVWSWTALAAARSPHQVKRIAGKRIPFDLYCSGCLGDVNHAVFFGRVIPELEMREPVPPYSLFSTDTSGGFFDALENFRRVNRGIHLDLVLPDELFAEHDTALDPLYSLIGGAGEYELLFAVPRGKPGEGVYLGSGTFHEQKENVFRWCCGRRRGVMRTAPPDYRNVPKSQWLEATQNYLQEMIK